MTASVLDAALHEVADGVFAYLQGDGGWCLNNAGVVVSGDQCALVDTAATQARARALRAAVASVAAAPNLVVNTHFHGDHTFGNSVFSEAVVVAHERARTEMATAGLHMTGLWPEVEWGELDLVLPSVTVGRGATLHVGDIAVELHHVGPAHTTHDLVAWIPRTQTLFTGDIVLNGVTPFVPMGSVSGSLAALAELRAFGARTLVPGHGPVAGPEAFDETEHYLRWLGDTARAGVAAGLSPLDLAREVDLGVFAALVDPERVVPNLHRAYAEERGAVPGVPLEIAPWFADMAAYHGCPPTCRA